MDEKRIREEKETIMDQDVQNLLTCLNTEADKIQAAVKKEDEKLNLAPSLKDLLSELSQEADKEKIKLDDFKAKQVPEEEAYEIGADYANHTKEVTPKEKPKKKAKPVGSQAEKKEVKKEETTIDRTVEFLTTKTEKVEPTPQAEEIRMLKMRLDVLQKQIGQLALGSSSGGGEVRLEFLDDIDRTTAKVDGKVLKYSTASSKWVGATDISGGNWTKVVANGDGNTTGFTVGADLDVDNFFIFLNGVHQESSSDFTYSGTTLTMGTAPVVGDRLVIMYATT